MALNLHDVLYGIVDASDAAIEPARLIEFVSDPTFGGLAVFIGKVRDHDQGKRVRGLHYDVFEPLALRRLEALLSEAFQTHPEPMKIAVQHAKGDLNIGDVAVVVAVGSAHRDLAFAVCRQLIDAIKSTAPIWKQEHYLDGESAWREGQSLAQDD